jgi:hypothetical protein
LPPATRSALANAEQALWTVIEATESKRSGELWTWGVENGHMVYVPFGQGKGDIDESNAVQLWSTVYLGVHRPITPR